MSIPYATNFSYYNDGRYNHVDANDTITKRSDELPLQPSTAIAANYIDMGKVAYNMATNIVMFCDGFVWRDLGTGTVTLINTGVGLTGGPITTTGTISIANTAVTPGSYDLASITVNAQGQITNAASGSIQAGTGITLAGSAGLVHVVGIANTTVAAGTYSYVTLTVNPQGQLTNVFSVLPSAHSVDYMTVIVGVGPGPSANPLIATNLDPTYNNKISAAGFNAGTGTLTATVAGYYTMSVWVFLDVGPGNTPVQLLLLKTDGLAVDKAIAEQGNDLAATGDEGINATMSTWLDVGDSIRASLNTLLASVPQGINYHVAVIYQGN